MEASSGPSEPQSALVKANFSPDRLTCTVKAAKAWCKALPSTREPCVLQRAFPSCIDAVVHDGAGEVDMQLSLAPDVGQVATARLVQAAPAAKSRAREADPSMNGIPPIQQTQKELPVTKAAEIVAVLKTDRDCGRT